MKKFFYSLLFFAFLLTSPIQGLAAETLPTEKTEGISEETVYQLYYMPGDSSEVYHLLFNIYGVRLEMNSRTSVPSIPIQQNKDDLCYLFKFFYVGDGKYTIACLGGNYSKRLGLVDGKIELVEAADVPEQQWYIIPNGELFEIRSAAEGNKCLTGVNEHASIYDPGIAEDGETALWCIAESEVGEPLDYYVYVKAPEHWTPAMYSPPDKSNPWNDWTAMVSGEDGWYYMSVGNETAGWTRINNLALHNLTSPNIHLDADMDIPLKPNQNCWVVIITDDPNVEGDLTYQVYDYNPDEPPKTADPVTLALPVFTLLTSAIALSFLLRRKRCI